MSAELPPAQPSADAGAPASDPVGLRRRRSAVLLLAAAFALACLLYCVSRMRSAPPAPAGPEAPLERFSAARALAALGRVGGDEPHPVGSAAHARTLAALEAELRGLGLEPEVQETIARGPNGAIALVRNVLARLPGRTGGAAVLLVAHYDSVAAGPGAGDDGSGVATLLEVARALAREPAREHPVWLLLTDGEELGLVGAAGFVAEHPALAEVAIVVNVEARGTSGPSAMFETSEANASLIRWYARSVARPSAVSAAYEIYKRMPNDTDLTVFKRAGKPGYNFAFIGGMRHYHTPLDDLAHLSPASVQHHGDNVLALARTLGDAPLGELEPGRRVYADLLGWTMISWPEGASLPLALVALALVITGCLRAHGGGRLTRRGVIAGALVTLTSYATAALAGLALPGALAWLRGVSDPWAGAPSCMRITLFAGALAAVLASTRPWTRRLGFAALSTGAALFHALAAIAVAALVPSASYLWILPALAAGAAQAAFAGRETAGARAALVCAPLAVAAVFWFPLVEAFELAFEFAVAPAITIWIGALASFAVPLLAETGENVRRGTSGLATAAMLLAFAAAVFAPARSSDAPGALSLVHVEDPASGSARWAARGGGGELPAELVSCGFGAQHELPAPWWPWKEPLPVAAATATGALPPEIERVGAPEVADGGGGERIRVRLRSQRSARAILLVLPSGLALASVRAHGDELVLAKPVSGLQLLAGFGGESIELELDRTQPGEHEVSLLDVVSGLPEGGAKLIEARGALYVPRGEGDLSVVGVRRTL